MALLFYFRIERQFLSFSFQNKVRPFSYVSLRPLSHEQYFGHDCVTKRHFVDFWCGIRKFNLTFSNYRLQKMSSSSFCKQTSLTISKSPILQKKIKRWQYLRNIMCEVGLRNFFFQMVVACLSHNSSELAMNKNSQEMSYLYVLNILSIWTVSF